MRNFFKHVGGVFIFVVAFAAAVALARFYGLLSAPVPWLEEVKTQEVARVAPVADGARDAVEVPLAARFVTLDLERRRSYTAIELARDTRQAAPAKLYVWTYFFTPEGAERREVWMAEPVEIAQPFQASNTVKLNTEAACTFCDDEGAPRGGYYARVYITHGAHLPVNVRRDGFDFDIRTASPVLVQGTHAHRAR